MHPAYSIQGIPVYIVPFDTSWSVLAKVMNPIWHHSAHEMLAKSFEASGVPTLGPRPWLIWYVYPGKFMIGCRP